MSKFLFANIIKLVFAILIVLLLARLIIFGLGANPASPVTAAILAVSDLLTWPFRVFFKPLPPLGFVGIDGGAVAATIVLLLLVWLVMRLLRLESES